MMKRIPWIGVDLDSTLAHYDSAFDTSHIGRPVGPMLERVKTWLQQGRTVKIFTARANPASYRNKSDYDYVIAQIQDWCQEYIGQRLEVTCCKDFMMIELWDDRCVQVQPNTGIPVQDFWRHSL